MALSKYATFMSIRACQVNGKSVYVFNSSASGCHRVILDFVFNDLHFMMFTDCDLWAVESMSMSLSNEHEPEREQEHELERCLIFNNLELQKIGK